MNRAPPARHQPLSWAEGPAAPRRRRRSVPSVGKIAYVAPLGVVPLGAAALGALARLAPHGLKLGAGGGRPVAWAGRWLFPLYHPGERALLHRPLERQHGDARALRGFVDRLDRAERALASWGVATDPR